MGNAGNYGPYQQPDGDYADGGRAGDAGQNYAASQSPPSPYGQPRVSRSGPSFGNGVNLQPSYFNNGNVDLGWALMKGCAKIKTVRIEVELGSEVQAQRWIGEAQANGYAVIATFHSAAMLSDPQKQDNPDELIAAANWWAAYYAALSQKGALIPNLMNEWGSHNISAANYALTYNQAIAIVRKAYSGPIVIDLPGYGQEADTARQAVSGTGGATISDPNIILSAHIYSQAFVTAKNGPMTTSDLDAMAAAGVDCMVGEFGDDGNKGKTQWQMLVTDAKSRGWPVLGWAWNGDGGSMNMIQPQFQVPGSKQPYAPTSYFNTICNLL